jgi:glycosyltransferase involved in cell wall biosynthesis
MSFLQGISGFFKEVNRPRDTASAPKINVLYIIYPSRMAGSFMVLLATAARLNRQKYKVICGLLTPDQDNIIPPDLHTINFNLPLLNGVIWLRFFLQLYWVIRRYNIHILHVNSYVPGHHARLAALWARVPIIIDHWHGFDGFNRKRRLVGRWLGRFTYLSLAVSEAVRRYIIQQCHLNPDKVRVVYNGIDGRRFQNGRPRALVRAEIGLPLDLPVIGIVSRLEHWDKGHQELFEAMALLRSRYTLHALIVGDGLYRAAMVRRVQELGLAGQVHFLGNREDIPDLLAAMDIFVLPSHNEGFCLAVAEAMAAGLPVIVSEVGGLPEVVQHQASGLLIPPGDAAALARGLSQLLENPAWAHSLGERARERVMTLFSLERMAAEIQEIYDEAVKGI